MSNSKIQYDTVLVFGNKSDRVIETVGKTGNGKAFEVGYYNGADKSKAIVNISPATGCPVGCNFCDLTDSGGPLSPEIMHQQVLDMVNFATKVDGDVLGEKKLKVNFAKTGEPVLNPYIVEAMHMISDTFPSVSFKYSTSLPNTPKTKQRIHELAFFADGYTEGSVQLQISLISTDNAFRQKSVGTKSKIELLPIIEVSELITAWHKTNPRGRVPNCSLLVSANTPCDPILIVDTIRPGNVSFRIRPVVDTEHGLSQGLQRAEPGKIEGIIVAFEDSSYDINVNGIPTPTEQKHGLASNVTRNRFLQGMYPKGMSYVDSSENLTPI